MKRRSSTWIALLVGLLAVTALIVWQGLGTVAEAFRTAGWRVLIVPLFYVPYIALRTLSWSLLFPSGRRPPVLPTLEAMWIGQSVNALLPVALVGGDLVKARRLAERGVSIADSAAALIVDKTMQVFGVGLMILGGIAILVRIGAERSILIAAGVGAALVVGSAVAFLIFQRRGLLRFLSVWLTRLTGRGQRFEEGALRGDELVRTIHQRPLRAILATLAHVACELTLAVELWLVADFVGHGIGFAEAVLLKALTAVVRGVAFVMPAGLGALEGGFVGIGAVIGLPADATLVMSLATRVRELVSGVPGLVAWQQAERKAYARARAGGLESDG